MLYKDDEVLVINRTKSDWPGLSFPGGHVEKGESLEEAVIREMKEETGFDIKNPILCAIKDWDWGNDTRYLGLLYKCNEFQGELKNSEEGEVFWIKKDKLLNTYPLSQDFEELYNLIEGK
jgi:8-oxo-dGTP diphosphatase